MDGSLHPEAETGPQLNSFQCELSVASSSPWRKSRDLPVRETSLYRLPPGKLGGVGVGVGELRSVQVDV